MNDKVLKIALDELFELGVSKVYFELAIKAAKHLKLPCEALNLDGTSFHVDGRYIPIAFQISALLSAFAHPDYLLFVGSRGFALSPPSSNLKSNGYNCDCEESDEDLIPITLSKSPIALAI